ncbi:MAG TPA: PQQ-dependent dehydrogenase, methanol/ethanol family [Steroidobacteraceae bacterium]|nr:PQQ-dependent dehydrogenase, methanol/ethanol family [Steroidobacteraceae bacterium]
MRVRRLLIVIGLVGSAVGAIALALPDYRWRSVVAARAISGQLKDVSWADLMDIERSDSGLQLRKLASSGNPYASVQDPDTAAADRTGGAQIFAFHCEKCHGTGASGGVGPRLFGRNLRHGDSDWAMYRTITGGVPGTAMTGGLIERPDVWRVIAYLKSLRVTAASGLIPGSGASNPPVLDATAERLVQSGRAPGDWLLPGGSYNGERFSPDSQINVSNVARLTVQWIHQFASTNNPNEAAPIVAGNYMFVTLPPSTVVALDVRTGAQLWQYTRTMPADLRLCCLSSNRGVAVLGQRVFVATLDAHLLALDAATGQLLWDRQIADYTEGYSMTSAPLPIGDRVVLGVAGGDHPIRGFIAAYDSATGAPRWRFHTVPEPGEPGNDTWGGDSWKTGGAGAWGIGAYDSELGLIYWGVGNAAPDYNPALRPGDNLYSNCVLAIDASTGKLAWHFQFSPSDAHDWDSTQTPALIDVTQDGTTSKWLAVANRNGFFYVLDRTNGHFVRGAPFARQTWASGLSATGRPIRMPNSDPTPQGVYLYPSVSGATNWWPSAYSPATQLYYANVVERGGLFFTLSPAPRVKPGQMYTGGTTRNIEGEPSEQFVRAIDPLTAKVRWERHNTSESEEPRGGLLATAGGLLVGSDGPKLYALDAATGAQLWSFDAGGHISAPPVTYRAGEEQIIAVIAGQDLLTFRLPH